MTDAPIHEPTCPLYGKNGTDGCNCGIYPHYTTALTTALTDGALADRLRRAATSPRTFTATDKTAFLNEAADRLDTKENNDGLLRRLTRKGDGWIVDLTLAVTKEMGATHDEAIGNTLDALRALGFTVRQSI